MRIYIFIISLFCSLCLYSQEKAIDSSSKKHRYGLRVGTDISKLIKTAIRSNYTAFEINADYKFAKKYYIAGEIGYENHLINETQINLNTKGSYIKFGVDYNAYQNWLNMENAIYAGLRYGFSSFSQTLNSYSIYNTDDYWNENNLINTPESFNGISSHWIEFIFGIKTEVLNNVYLGVNVQLKRNISNNSAENFDNLYIPGFGKTYETSKWGVGFGYTINYFIPFYKK
ncbi:DUF6048 family protein [Pseudofulvibacter geojedonensis]|uniref:DUF6048 family protein n=1 Tax=Pseudofulvibacter geojedonensis TaxID=1123758 RepID=A0ABW3HZQ8_9FLAO